VDRVHGHHKRTAAIAAGVALALALAGAAYAAVAARSSATAATVKVTESEYHIKLSTTSVKAGNITFVIHNGGKLLHKLDISGGGLTTLALGATKPGTTRSKTVKLAGGTLSLWCPIPGHASLGMKASLKIAGAAGGGTGTTPQTTTGGSTWG
jgi:uncharacterized cupredoxin-like copper-binding protein